MRPPSKALRQRQRGSVMVESSLTLLAFISLFVATLDLAQILYIHQSLVERARVAARTAAVSCCNVDSVRNTILYGSSATPVAGTPTYWGLSSSNVDVSFSDQNSAHQRVTVRISGLTYKSYTPMMGATLTNIPVQVTVPLELP